MLEVFCGMYNMAYIALRGVDVPENEKLTQAEHCSILPNPKALEQTCKVRPSAVLPELAWKLFVQRIVRFFIGINLQRPIMMSDFI